MSDRPTGFYWVKALPEIGVTKWQVAEYYAPNDAWPAGCWYVVGRDEPCDPSQFEMIGERVERTRRWRGTFRRLDTGKTLTVEVLATSREEARPRLIDAWRHGLHMTSPPPPWQLDTEVVEYTH